MNTVSGRLCRASALALFFLLALPVRAAQQPEMVYAGEIGGKLGIEMHLHFEQDQVTGTYFYEKHHQDIELRGKVDAAGTITLMEIDPEAKAIGTGVFHGKRVSADRIEGYWSRPDGTHELPFAVELRQPAGGQEVKAEWAGKWQRVGDSQFNGADLEISNVGADDFAFLLSAQEGANTGEVSGAAKLQAGRAVYKDPESGCEVVFRLAGGEVAVSTSSECSYFAGAGVTFDGTYGKDVSRKPMSLVELGAVETAAEEQALQKLTGPDFDLFTNSFQIVSDDEDLDGFGAKVHSAGVRGMFTLMESIVMTAADGRIWAAAIDPDTDVVKYWTNVAGQEKKLPKTIEGWRERFADKQVVYASAPS